MRAHTILIIRWAVVALFTVILYGAGVEFYNIAWGTGNWWGEFSLKWGVLFIFFVALCAFLIFILWFALWNNFETAPFIKLLIGFRDHSGLTRYLVAIGILVLPVWLLQYSYWGVVFDKPYLRSSIWLVTLIFLTFLITNGKGRIGTWAGFLAAVFLSAAVFSFAASITNVTGFPFSLGWSEGNRMWDYSLLFGSRLYKYASANPPSAYLDLGRQLSGGLPFLFGKVTIVQERLWLALMDILPYVLLGWIAFRLPRARSKLLPFLAGVWVWMFLSQGPIHTPLLWSAVLVVLAWDSPVWSAVPLILISAYITTISRSTWVFAPAMWIGMLELSSVPLNQFRMNLQTWARPVGLVLAGLAGGPFYSTIVSLGGWLATFFSRGIVSDGMPSISPGSVTVSSVTASVTKQPLLWYRLLPNATYGNGILLGLLIAVLPVILVLIYLYISRIWKLNIWQRFVILFSLMAFLIVGLIVSTKIGGGGDLHNMDMFLIGVIFTVALAWRAGGAEWLGGVERSTILMRIVILLSLAIFGFVPLMNLRPIAYSGDLEWLARLADARAPNNLGFLPSNELTQAKIQMIRDYVQQAKSRGEVLFMDQRQLLTFGYIQDVRLVSEYEKKLMMDRALSSDAAYFEPFYTDLASHRFALIISDPLRAPIKDSDYQFGEENNAWVKWVAIPVLCYYEPVETDPKFRLQLLVPKDNTSDCSHSLP
jgi:hypothetical protein